MKRKRLYIIAYIVLVACLLPVVARGQQIVWEGVDTVACRSEWVPIGIGYGSGHEVVVRDGVASLTHVERIFLPDGVPCGGMGCAYRSPVTFTGFAPGGTIQSANDILYVRLKMEHSYLGDIYINITCPNGQVASLMNWSGMGSSSCSSTVPTAHRSWSSGTNASGGTFLGQAYDYGNGTYKCDSTATGNEPGVGWNYCWSSNTTAGYGYAAGDGRIYRATNVTGGIKDSSDVAGRTNFYHPDDHFSALVGCPLNGDWYIEVLDAYSQDNGYIFEWELSLDPELMPTASTMDSCRVTGDTVVKVDDSTFMVSTPAWVTSPDTTLTYTVYIYGSSGEVIDTTVSVRFVEQRRTEIREHGCDGDTISVGGYVFTESVTRVDTLAGTGGCPELVDIDVRFAERYEVWDTGRFCPGEAMVHGGVDYGVTGDYKLLLESVEGCDSTVYLRMELVDSGFRAEPYISDNGGEEWWNDTMLAGCVPYEMWMLDRSPLGVARSWRSEDSVWTAASDTIATHTYDSAGVYDIWLAARSEHGCRDTARMARAVWVYETPVADFEWSPEFPVASHPDIELFALEDSLGRHPSYEWTVQTSDGAGKDTVYGPTPRYSWSMDGGAPMGDFEVVLTAILDYNGPYGDTVFCYDSASRMVTIVNDWLQFPNLVSPNGDGVNDRWRVVNLLECGQYSMNELWIYNSWGVLVYHVENIREEGDFWDPKETGSADGTYYYRFTAKSMFGVVKRNGVIEVVR